MSLSQEEKYIKIHSECDRSSFDKLSRSKQADWSNRLFLIEERVNKTRRALLESAFGMSDLDIFKSLKSSSRR